MKKLCFILFFLSAVQARAQSPGQLLENSVKTLEADSQMRHALLGLYVIDRKSGKVIVDRNSQIGLAPASTQKLLTSIAAIDMMGISFRYATNIYFEGIQHLDTLDGNMIIQGSGDPTFGSWRFNNTSAENIFNSIFSAIARTGINVINGNIIISDTVFDSGSIPAGWIWEDIGNYYGAGVWGLNWRENQYDLLLRAGNDENDSVQIIGTRPEMNISPFINELKTGPKGSGDRAFIYFSPYLAKGFVRGTIPPGEKNFIISGSMPSGPLQFADELDKELKKHKIIVSGQIFTGKDFQMKNRLQHSLNRLLISFLSPSLDSVNYWFLKKSINLYGEALLKTFAHQKTGIGTTEKGIETMLDFWSQNGIEKSAIQVMDGSGLSPQNRVTAYALVRSLKYAATRPWFNSFYQALPEINGMRMKSGSIEGARSFAGYHRSRSGVEYVFAIIVNNYSGSSSLLVKKMWELLDILK